MSTLEDRERVMAVSHLVRSTGGREFQLRYTDDAQPVVWIAVATYGSGGAQADAALTPEAAAWRLAERLVDGGRCTHCHRATALVDDEGLTPSGLCVYRYRAGKIRRGCDSLPIGTR